MESREEFFETTNEFESFLRNDLRLDEETRKRILEEEAPHYDVARDLGYSPRYVATPFWMPIGRDMEREVFRFSVSLPREVLEEDKLKILAAPRNDRRSPQDLAEMEKIKSKEGQK